MKKRIVILLELFLLFVVLLAPASLITELVPEQDKFQLSGVSGSIWSGTVEQINLGPINLQQVDFSPNLLAFFKAKLGFNLTINQGDIIGNLDAEIASEPMAQSRFDSINLKLDAESLQPLLPLAGTELGGEVKLTDFALALENKRPQEMQGELSWKNAQLGYAGERWQLGDFVAHVSSDEQKGRITAQLAKSDNKLGLQGKLTLSKDGVLLFVGSISTQIDKALYNGIALFNDGKPSNGRLPIKFQQKIYR